MKQFLCMFLLWCSFSIKAQVLQHIYKTNGEIITNQTSAIDSIVFPVGSSEIDLLMSNGEISTYQLLDINHVSFSDGFISSLLCADATINADLIIGITATGVFVTVPYTGGNGGLYIAKTVASGGVAGLTARLLSGYFNLGDGTLSYLIEGTPSGAGTATFDLEIGGQSCVLSLTVYSGLRSTCGAPDVHNPALQYGSITDIDSNVYKTIVIGTQEWMAEDLRSNHFTNGEAISVSTFAVFYENDSVTYSCPYGRLYNYNTIADSREICPSGWHIPSDADWNKLVKFIDPLADTMCLTCVQSTIAGDKMKCTGTQYWQSTQTGTRNSSGLSLLPGGAGDSPDWLNMGVHAYYWSATTGPNYLFFSRFFDKNNGYVTKFLAGSLQYVRCIKN